MSARAARVVRTSAAFCMSRAAAARGVSLARVVCTPTCFSVGTALPRTEIERRARRLHGSPRMDNDSGSTRSIWSDVPELPARPALRENLRADVCVVGAGMAGLSAAYMLSREGRRVAVIDDGPIAGGETSRTTAHLTFIVDDRYHWIEHVHGAEGARVLAQSHSAAVDRIEAVAREEGIDCDFERLDGYLFVPPGDPWDELEREFEAAVRAGV